MYRHTFGDLQVRKKTCHLLTKLPHYKSTALIVDVTAATLLKIYTEEANPNEEIHRPDGGHIVCYFFDKRGRVAFYDSIGERPERYYLPQCRAFCNIFSQSTRTTICAVGTIMYVILRWRGMLHAHFCKIMRVYRGDTLTVQEREQAIGLFARSTKIYWNLEGNTYRSYERSVEVFLELNRNFIERPKKTTGPKPKNDTRPRQGQSK